MILILFIFNINLFSLESRWMVICKMDLWIYEKCNFFWASDFSDIAWYYLFSCCFYLLNRTHHLPAVPQLNCFYKTSVFSLCYLISLVSIFMKFTSRKEIYSQDNSVSYVTLVGLSLFSEKRASVAPANSSPENRKLASKERKKRDIFVKPCSRNIYLTICLAVEETC